MQKKTKLFWWITYFIGLIAVFFFVVSVADISTQVLGSFLILMEFCYTVFFVTVFFTKEIAFPSVQKIDANILNAPEEFNNILQYMEARNILDFGIIQKKLSLVVLFRRVTFVMMVVSFFVMVSEMGDMLGSFYYMAPITFIVSIVFLRILNKYNDENMNEFVYMYKKEIIPTLLNQMNRNLNYVPLDPEKIEEYEKLYERSEFSRDFENLKAEDFIEGYVVADITVRMADIIATKEGPEGENLKLFGGLFAHFDNVKYNSMKEIAIRTDKDYGKLDSLKVLTGNQEFDKNFIVYTSNQDIVIDMKASGYLDALMELRNKHDCKFEIIIREGEIYIQIPFMDVFEPNFFDITGGRKTLYQHYRHYKLFFDVFHITRNFIEG